ncbi:glycosyltransferase family 4 protein [Clostridium beijerinckii]|uniref:Glycosyltransferase involved in cell wall biosynthesis n=1 Tax=Clostridium beijerinckii TaxID=1520 RepID=A0AAE5H8X3_CLOBE|nr:glycosyltransferase family 4 protein [Clostridium beijerinckii]NSB16558.1 glycosyltransferase involved in cell wall biosynthesis [Clostridium beijerinckii]OOM23612.1 putative glycosyltransferase EpsD [Clostridium beijerinckii]
MNILFIAHEGELNGASLSLLGIIDIIKYENNIFVLTPSKNGQFVNELKNRGINYLYVPYYRWMASNNCGKLKWYVKKIIYAILGLSNYLTAYKVGRLIKENNIKIIHSNSSVINMGAILAKKYNISHIWHIREFGKEDFNMEFVYPTNICLKFMNNTSDKIVCISKAIEEKYTKYLDVNKCKLIYNGLSEEYIQKKQPKNTSFFNFLIAGRLEEAKGQKEAILAINEVVVQGKKNIKLYIAGAGGLEKELRNIVEKLKLSDYIEFCGRVSNLKEMRKKIDVELVCSRSEAFGRVTIESMMSSNPVIGANTGGTKELIIEGFNGYLYEQGNYINLARTIEKIMNDNDKFNEMSRNAYFYSKEKFTSKINSDNILNLYKEVLSE